MKKKFFASALLVSLLSSCDKTEEITYFCDGHRDTVYVYNNDTIYVHTSDSVFVNSSDTVLIDNTDQFYFRYTFLQDSKYFTDTISITDENIYELQHQYPNQVEVYDPSTGNYKTIGLWRYEWYELKKVQMTDDFYGDYISDLYDDYLNIEYNRRVLGPVRRGYRIEARLEADRVYERSGGYFAHINREIAEENCIPKKMFKIILEVSKNHEPFQVVRDAYGEIEYTIE